MANWAELNHDLLFEVADRIASSKDFAAFRGVCTSWSSTATLEHFIRKFLQPPLLMLAEPEPANNSSSRGFFNISNVTISEFILPEANDKKCIPSKGWLLTIAKDRSMSLLHPFSRVQIELPHLNTFENISNYEPHYKTENMYSRFIEKCVLSSSPSDSESDYIVTVIYGTYGRLAYYKPGEKGWTAINTSPNAYCLDITYRKGLLYVIDNKCNLKTYDLRGVNPIVAQVETLPMAYGHVEKAYVVESMGSILVVSRHLTRHENRTYKTSSFQVFKLESNGSKSMKVDSLGNRAIFLGFNSSVSVDILDVSLQCKPNCIYFSDDVCQSYYTNPSYPRGGGSDMGVYNVQEGSIHKCFDGDSYHRITPPMWAEQRP